MNLCYSQNLTSYSNLCGGSDNTVMAVFITFQSFVGDNCDNPMHVIFDSLRVFGYLTGMWCY